MPILDDQSPEPVLDARLTAGRAQRHDASSQLILVIEDEPGIVDFLERGLTALGFAVISARDGEAGAERALGENVDLVVLDLMLPKRSGLEVLADLQDAKPAVPVIVLSALDALQHRVTGLEAGAVDYLTKPFSLSDLGARIRTQLRVAAQTGNEESGR